MTLSSLPAISCRNGVEFRNRANLVLVRVSELAAHSLAALVAATTLLSIATGAAANAQPFSQGAAQRAESSLNDPVSQFELGMQYWLGTSVPQDSAEAAKWFGLAAEQGHADAQFNLGVMYAKGWDVLPSGAASADWYYKAGLAYLKQGQKENTLLRVERIRNLEAKLHHTVPNMFLADELLRLVYDTVDVEPGRVLPRRLKHLIVSLEEFRALGVDFISYREAVDTSTPAGKMLFSVIGAMAEFERELIRERVAAGLAKAKSKGVRLGRPRREFDLARARELRHQGLSLRGIAKQLGVNKDTLRAALADTAGTRPSLN